MARDIVDGVVTLVGAGFSEYEVLHEWPYDKFELFRKGAGRKELRDRQAFVTDVANAIGGVFGGKGLSKYIENMQEVIDSDL